MEKELSVTEARNEFHHLIENVLYQGGRNIVTRRGKPAAVVVPFQLYMQFKLQREEFFDLVREIQSAADLDAADADLFAAEAVVNIRNEEKQEK